MRDKGIKIRDTLKQHILNNKKEYIVVMLFFLVGIFLGVFFVNNIQETQRMEISSYLTNFIEKMKITENLNYMDLLKNSMGQNILLAIMIWFFGTTVIRNTSIFWNCILYRILIRIYYICMCIYFRNRKGNTFYIIKFSTTKFNFYTSYISFSS